MAEHMYMFSGESIPVKLETTEDMMQELVDWFGNDFRVEKISDGRIRARIICNAKAMRFWALQYGPYVEVLEPKALRNQVAADVKEMAKKYK
nr:WYL domain-containing protein [Lachnospiraceae bacterium]